ncbi:MAG: galactosyltransferase-related protein [Planctomycetota bacterium]|jgi:GT2 family glycosyltransferase
MGGPGGEAHLVIPTHTTRWLRRTLVGVARQDKPPDSITVTSDTDRPDIRTLLVETADEMGLAMTLVCRPHQGMERLSQVRNNAVRALLGRGVSPDARLIFLDGDCVPQPDMVARHLSLGRGGDLVIAFRIDLTAEQTHAFDEAALLEGRPPISPTAAQLEQLARRHRRYRRQQLLRRLGLAKRHKPKPLGGHHSVSLAMCRAVNGFDEEYHTWGTEDDDFARRVYAAGGTSVVAVRDIVVYHQHHPARAPGPWHDRANAKLFRQRRPTRCAHGIEAPLPQGAVEEIPIEPGNSSRTGREPDK